MKKFISTLLSLALILTANLVFAEKSTENMERILVSVKERIGNTDEYSEFEYDESNNNGKSTLRFFWNTSPTGDNYKSLSVYCNAEGIITHYSKYDSTEHSNRKTLSINGTKKAEALSAAKDYIKKLNPEIADKLVITDTNEFENFKNSYFNFEIQRYENEIPVLSDTGYMSLNSDCSLDSFSLTYTSDFTFENVDNPISKDTAIANFNKDLGVKLSYITDYYNNNQKEAKLVYSIDYNNKYIHATTGEVVEINPYYDLYNENLKQEDSFIMNSPTGGSNYRDQLSDSELKSVLEVEGLLSEEEAENIITGYDFFNIPSTTEEKYSNFYHNNADGTYYYSFDYKIDDSYSYVTIDAKTGEIIQYNNWIDIPADANINVEKVNNISDIIIKTLAKDKYAEYKKADSDTDSPFSNNYVRYVNDIPFMDNSIYISFDPTYTLTNYSISHSDIAFPSPENIVTPAEAVNVMDSLGNYSIVYMPDVQNKKFIPVYNFSEGHTVDAHTGKSLYEISEYPYNGTYTDISGHYAEEKIKTLSSYGIFLDGTELKPDEAITQRDFVALLSVIFCSRDISVLRSYSDDKTVYNHLPQNFISENEIDPTAHLTRSTAAKLMVKSMGAEEYAKLQGIYATLYNDVTEDIGYINILTGMGVLSGDGSGNFNPSHEITRAQALIMIYNYLSR